MANSWINPNTRNAIYKRDNMTCVYCGCECEKGNSTHGASLDHIVSQKELASVAMDDKHFGELRRDPKNLVLACRNCNSKKQHYTVFEFCKRYNLEYTDIIADIAKRVNTAI